MNAEVLCHSFLISCLSLRVFRLLMFPFKGINHWTKKNGHISLGTPGKGCRVNKFRHLRCPHGERKIGGGKDFLKNTVS